MTLLLLALIAALTAAVWRFARTALAGDPGRPRFLRTLIATAAAVAVVVVAGNALVFAGAWVATSVGLHRLLLFYPARPGAVLAARKKFVVSRLGDLCLIAALALMWRSAGTWDFDQLFAHAAATVQTHGAAPPSLQAIGVLLVAAAMLKSAQFPFHSWLPDTMETPTPVSALMHAGIINAGGILIIRTSPLLIHTPAALALLAVIGALTALFAGVVMLTQASVKRGLAFSTVAQMGFMLLECGLGMFHLAALHLVAHSVYKAYAFLSAGEAVETPAAAPAPRMRASLAIAAAVLATAATTAVARLLHIDLLESIGAFSLAALFTAASAALATRLWHLPSRAGRWAGVAAPFGLAAVYLGLHVAFEALIPGRVVWPLTTAWLVAIVALAMLAYSLTIAAPALGSRPWAHRLYVHARNGFYLNTLANRLAAGQRSLRRIALESHS